MTDKQIIIDGVDVLNCGYFSQFEGKTENACYIQPRKVIGSDVNIGFGSCDCSPNCYYKQLKRKEQECEDLKEIREQLGYFKAENMEYLEYINDINKRIDKHENALQEIKEIAEDAKTKVFVDMEDFWEQILQKISEVLNDEI